MTGIGKRIANQVTNNLTRRASKGISDSIVKGAKKGAGKFKDASKGDDGDKGPKRDIAKEIKHHKRKFDEYLVVVSDEGLFFAVDADRVRADDAAKMFLDYRPMADAAGAYSEGRLRWDVKAQRYEVVPEGADQHGSFKVHLFYMEERGWDAHARQGGTPYDVLPMQDNPQRVRHVHGRVHVPVRDGRGRPGEGPQAVRRAGGLPGEPYRGDVAGR